MTRHDVLVIGWHRDKRLIEERIKFLKAELAKAELDLSKLEQKLSVA